MVPRIIKLVLVTQVSSTLLSIPSLISVFSHNFGLPVWATENIHKREIVSLEQSHS